MTEFFQKNKLFVVVGANGVILLMASLFAALLHYNLYQVISDPAPVQVLKSGALNNIWTFSKYLTLLLGLGIMVFAGIVIPSAIKREDENANISTMAKNFEKQAVTDTLTQLPNRRYFEQAFEAYLREFNSLGKSFGLLVLDLDFFKSVNDTYGHDVGDLVLQEVSLRLNAITREHDIVARLGGEEFAVLTPCTSQEQLLAIAERYRANIESLAIEVGEYVLRPTVSIGVATNGPETRDIDHMFKQADFKLYEAKRNGRNRVAA